MEEAHTGLIADPSKFTANGTNSCSGMGCHEELAGQYKNSMHQMAWGERKMIATRSGVSDFEDCPQSTKDGFNDDVDDLRDIIHNGKKYVLEYEQEQKKKWNLTTGLKVGYNNILGYYIEITLRTLKNIRGIPEEYNERATLKNAKRYTTKRLKELEEKIVNAEEKINDLEYEIFNTIRENVEKETKAILETAKNIWNGRSLLIHNFSRIFGFQGYYLTI